MLDISYHKPGVQEKPAQQANDNPVPQPPVAAVKHSEPLEMPTMASLDTPSTLKIGGIFAIILVLIFVGAFTFLFLNKYFKTSQIKLAHAKLNQLNEEIVSAGLADIEVETLKLQKGAEEVNSFLAKSFLWSSLFSQLENLLLKDIKLENFSVNAKDVLIIKGEAGNYDSIAKFMESLTKSKKFSEIKLTSASKTKSTSNQGEQKEKTTFEISAKIDKKSFKADQLKEVKKENKNE